MQNAGLDEAQAGIKIAGRNINNLRYTDDTTLVAESEEELKSLLMKGNEESEKAGLKLSIQNLRSWDTGCIQSVILMKIPQSFSVRFFFVHFPFLIVSNKKFT